MFKIHDKYHISDKFILFKDKHLKHTYINEQIDYNTQKINNLTTCVQFIQIKLQ